MHHINVSYANCMRAFASFRMLLAGRVEALHKPPVNHLQHAQPSWYTSVKTMQLKTSAQ